MSKGFTLIELLIYIVIFVLLITVITLFAISFTKAGTKSQIKREVVLGTYSVMRTIIYEIKKSDNVYVPTSVFDVHPGQLSLKTEQESSTEEDITYIDFYLDDNNRLYLKREGQDPQLLVSENLKVTNLEFENISSSSESIKINLTLEYDIPVSEYQYSYSLSSSGSTRK